MEMTEEEFTATSWPPWAVGARPREGTMGESGEHTSGLSHGRRDGGWGFTCHLPSVTGGPCWGSVSMPQHLHLLPASGKGK